MAFWLQNNWWGYRKSCFRIISKIRLKFFFYAFSNIYSTLCFLLRRSYGYIDISSFISPKNLHQYQLWTKHLWNYCKVRGKAVERDARNALIRLATICQLFVLNHIEFYLALPRYCKEDSDFIMSLVKKERGGWTARTLGLATFHHFMFRNFISLL